MAWVFRCLLPLAFKWAECQSVWNRCRAIKASCWYLMSLMAFGWCRVLWQSLAGYPSWLNLAAKLFRCPRWTAVGFPGVSPYGWVTWPASKAWNLTANCFCQNGKGLERIAVEWCSRRATHEHVPGLTMAKAYCIKPRSVVLQHRRDVGHYIRHIILLFFCSCLELTNRCYRCCRHEQSSPAITPNGWANQFLQKRLKFELANSKCQSSCASICNCYFYNFSV